MYIKVLLPLAIPKSYTYRVPEQFKPQVQFGIRVEIPLRRRLYSGIIVNLEAPTDELVKPKNIISIIDDTPIVTHHQLKLWQWIADYYCCTIGQVMNIALPSGLKLHSETKISAIDGIDMHLKHIEDDEEFMIAEALSNTTDISIHELQSILGKKTVYPKIKALLDKGYITITEQLLEKYKAKTQDFIRFSECYRNKEASIINALDLTKRSEKQTETILALSALSPTMDWVDKAELYKKCPADSTVINALIKKGIVEKEKFEVSRILQKNFDEYSLPPMSQAQQAAYEEIQQHFEDDKNVLLFGVTGSGKTRIYTEVIQETIDKGKQVLFLLPEIALTTQIVQRLEQIFGNEIAVYHSRLNPQQRVELYKSALEGKKIFVGARSSIFLPFRDLGLVVVDEEHDPSYKQTDPAPRYQGRDTSLYLAHMFKANVILGSATPSMETFLNGKKNKLGVVNLIHRYGDAVLPSIDIVDLKDMYNKGKMRSMFSLPLLDAMKESLALGEQILLFQNRRGYSPTIQCTVCEWNAECPNCDVNLTTHQYFDELRCHYCGYKTKPPKQCPACGNTKLIKLGFGTEKIEDDIRKYLPDARVARLDYDTAKTRSQFENIIYEFSNHNVDILIGTQMITKGLDFDNIGLVGVLLADKIMSFPDFRANERAFQLFTQVAGRAGRRKKQGKVMIQTFTPLHDVIKETVALDYKHYYTRELREREEFKYPPYYRQILLTIKHKDPKKTEHVAQILAERLRSQLGRRIIGPAAPSIARIRNQYIQQITVKTEKSQQTIRQIKDIILREIVNINNQKQLSTVRVIVNVDP